MVFWSWKQVLIGRFGRTRGFIHSGGQICFYHERVHFRFGRQRWGCLQYQRFVQLMVFDLPAARFGRLVRGYTLTVVGDPLQKPEQNRFQA